MSLTKSVNTEYILASSSLSLKIHTPQWKDVNSTIEIHLSSSKHTHGRELSSTSIEFCHGSPPQPRSKRHPFFASILPSLLSLSILISASALGISCYRGVEMGNPRRHLGRKARLQARVDLDQVSSACHFAPRSTCRGLTT